MKEDFDFDDFDSEINNDDFSYSNESSEFDNFDDFENTDNDLSDIGDSTQEGKNSVIKTASILVVVGLVIIAFAFMLMRAQNKKKVEPIKSENTPNVEVGQNNVPNNISSNNSDWISFEGDENITFEDNYMDSMYTVTGINHYVKVVDGESNLSLKTVLKGNLSGFTGTYDLEVPYSKGKLLSIGNSFGVAIQFGKYNESIIIGEIKY